MSESASLHQKAHPVGWLPGLALVAVATVAAIHIADWAGLPAIVTALLIGMAVNPFLGPIRTVDAGVAIAADPLMKFGIVCLGAGVNLFMLADLGWPVLMSVVAAIGMTVLCGHFVGRWLGQTARFSILSAGAVAICGASAALAICCALPKGDSDERDLSVVIIAVSLLSAAGIILYPLLTHALGLSDSAAGFVFGGSLHNVAQAIATGFSVSDLAGETATLVKMGRVALLAPFVMLVALLYGRESSGARRRGLARPPLFLIGFLVLMGVAATGLISPAVEAVFGETARLCLLLAMVAIGMRTSVIDLAKVDYRAMLLLLAETATILIVVLVAAKLTGL